MLPSQYHYIKRMWTRNYPRRRPGIISTIFWFPIKFCFFIIIAMTMTAFYILGVVAWGLLVFIWELIKIFAKFFKDLFVGLSKLVFYSVLANREKSLNNNFNIDEIKASNNYNSQFDKNKKTDLYNLGKYIIENNQVHIPTIQRTFKLSYNNTIRLLDELNEKGVIKTCENYNDSIVLLDMDSFNKIIQ